MVGDKGTESEVRTVGGDGADELMVMLSGCTELRVDVSESTWTSKFRCDMHFAPLLQE